jgi:hypothetical protein
VAALDPSNWPELEHYPTLREFVRLQLDMQFGDIRMLLRFPERDGEYGCNLAIASLLFNLIAGVSVVLYRSSVDALEQRGERGERFKELLVNYYPWTDADVAAEEAAPALWVWGRNPLAHSLGIGPDQHKARLPGDPVVGGHPVSLWFAKGPLTPEQIEELASSPQRPDWIGPTLQLEGEILKGQVVALAWGVHQMLRNLFAEDVQARAAEETMRELWQGHLA